MTLNFFTPDVQTTNLNPLTNFEPALNDLRSEVVNGLRQDRRTLPCKLFYDRRGSQLFDQICQLPEYYPTRIELSITRRFASQIAHAIGSEAGLVEFGSGSSRKTRVLLDHLDRPAAYVPIDISREHLLASAHDLAVSYPRLPIYPICADYTSPFRLPPAVRLARRITAYFPGSTIGNFEPPDALAFLKSVRRLCGADSSLLIGVDMKKDPAILHRAYNDAADVTAAFNLNVLSRLNVELSADFDLARFHHYAYFNPILGRVEMHLVSAARQTVHVAGESFTFELGESIHTENCYKYSIPQFQRLAQAAGYAVQALWQDEASLFSLFLLRTTDGNAALPA